MNTYLTTFGRFEKLLNILFIPGQSAMQQTIMPGRMCVELRKNKLDNTPALPCFIKNACMHSIEEKKIITALYSLTYDRHEQLVVRVSF